MNEVVSCMNLSLCVTARARTLLYFLWYACVCCVWCVYVCSVCLCECLCACVSPALDAASDAYVSALAMVARSTQAALTQTQAEEFEVTVAAAEDAMQVALKTAKKKVTLLPAEVLLFGSLLLLLARMCDPCLVWA